MLSHLHRNKPRAPLKRWFQTSCVLCRRDARVLVPTVVQRALSAVDAKEWYENVTLFKQTRGSRRVRLLFFISRSFRIFWHFCLELLASFPCDFCPRPTKAAPVEQKHRSNTTTWLHENLGDLPYGSGPMLSHWDDVYI
jgi:hypothetical protein